MLRGSPGVDLDAEQLRVVALGETAAQVDLVKIIAGDDQPTTPARSGFAGGDYLSLDRLHAQRLGTCDITV